MDDGSITLLAALIILVAFSAFFSASETAFSSLNQIRLKSRAEDGDSAAARVLAMSEKYDKLLSTILIGNNIVNIAAASIGTVLFTRLLDPERGATVSTFVLTIVVLIFGEVTPKSLAKEMPETVATAVSPFLNLLMILFTPLTWLFTQWKRLLGHFIRSTEEDTITEGELMTMVSEAENDGELTDRESQLIRSAIEFDDVEVEEILTQQNSLVTDAEASIVTCDLKANTVTFSVAVVPKTFVEGMTVEFLAENGEISSDVVGKAGEDGTNQRFSAALSIPLTDDIALSALLVLPDGTRQTQPLQTYTGLYSGSLPEVQMLLDADIQGRAAVENGTLTLPEPIEFLLSMNTKPDNVFVPRAEAVSTQVGLFKNKQLIAWA